VAPGSADSESQVSLLLKELQLQRDERVVQDLTLHEQAVQHREEAAVHATQHREQVAAAAAAQTALTNSVAMLTTKLVDQEKAIADFTSEKKSEKEEEKEVPYVPHRNMENQHPERPKFQKNNEPQLYDPANIDAVWQLLCTAERATAAGWEYRHLIAYCSYLQDVVLHEEAVFPRIIERLQKPDEVFKREDGTVVTVEEDIVNLLACYNSTEKIYTNLINKRCNLIQLKAIVNDKYPSKDNALKRDSLIQILEDEVYGILGGLMQANIGAAFEKCIEVYAQKTEAARLKTAASAGAKAKGAGAASAGGKAALSKKFAKEALPAAE
jgi:hypothetical protein